MSLLKDYYTYTAAPGVEWWVKTPPRRNLHFERELELLAGCNTFGKPILRVSWGGTLKSDVAAKDTLKYKKIWKGMTAIVYTDESGESHTVSPTAQVPADAVSVPVYTEIELGNLRWYVEKWQSVEDAIRGGRFTDLKGEDGTRLFRSPPPEGVYNSWILIESASGGFRDLDDAVLEEVKRQWHWNENTSLDRKVKDLIEDEKREVREAAQAGRAAWMS